MGVIHEIFAAPSDEAAAATISRAVGPDSQRVAAPAEAAATPPKRGLFSRKPQVPPATPAFVTDESLPVYDTVAANGLDATVQLGTLEELLTGVSYDQIEADPATANILASRDDDAGLVIAVREPLTTALASATDERLAEVAVPWSETEEFWGQADPSDLAEFLRELATLAHQARDQGHRLYSWISL